MTEARRRELRDGRGDPPRTLEEWDELALGCRAYCGQTRGSDQHRSALARYTEVLRDRRRAYPDAEPAGEVAMRRGESRA